MKSGEMQVQQDIFDEKMAKAVSAASDRQSYFDEKMATAELKANDMKIAYDKLTRDNAEQKLDAVRCGLI